MVKLHIPISICGVFGCECERIAHSMRDKNACDIVDVAKRNDQFVDLPGRHGIKPGCGLVIKHNLRLAD